MINKLIRMASHLDSKGHIKEANYIDALIQKIASGKDYDPSHTGAGRGGIGQGWPHETGSMSLEGPDAASAELGEEFDRLVRPAERIAEMIIGSTPMMGEDAEASAAELTNLLSSEEHLETMNAILDYLDSLSPSEN